MKNAEVRAARDRAVLARIAAYFLGGFLASLCTLEGRAPLSAGVVGALCPGAGGAAAFAGAAVGAAAALDFGAGVRLGGTLTLIAASLSAFRDAEWIGKAWFRPVNAGVCTALVELACTVRPGMAQTALVSSVTAAVLAAALCHYCALLLGSLALPKRRESRETEKLRERLRMGAEALRALCESIGGGGKSTEEDPSVIFDRAAEVVCRGCALCEVCWSREYITTFNAFNDATPALLERGRAESADFALHFSSRCIHFAQLLSAINTEVSAYLLRRQCRRQIETERRRVRGQYAQLSELVVQTLAASERKEIAAREVFFEVAMGCEAKEGQRVSGDSVTYFKVGGVLHLLLSDGMGSGREAQRESRLALRLIEQFLTAGIEPECALRTLNAALNIRSDERGGFTTIDLLSVDLADRHAALCKYGAAPTYVKRNGAVRRLTGSALPAGLQEVGSNVAPIRFHPEENTFVLMVSDGVADSGDDKWLLDLLAGWQGADPHALVTRVMEECRKRRHGDDDRSALCLYLPGEETGKGRV